MLLRAPLLQSVNRDQIILTPIKCLRHLRLGKCQHLLSPEATAAVLFGIAFPPRIVMESFCHEARGDASGIVPI